MKNVIDQENLDLFEKTQIEKALQQQKIINKSNVEGRLNLRFEHKTEKNKDGTPLRCRQTGQVKTWKTRPEDFKIPVKHGLKTSFYIDNFENKNNNDWVIV